MTHPPKSNCTPEETLPGFQKINGLVSASLALGWVSAADGAIVHVTTAENFNQFDFWTIPGLSTSGGIVFNGGTYNNTNASYFVASWYDSEFEFVRSGTTDSDGSSDPYNALTVGPGASIGNSLPFYDYAIFTANQPSAIFAFRHPDTIGEGDFFYGWARIETGGGQLTILEYAYEDQVDTPIAAGAVPEASSLGLLALGAAGMSMHRRRKKVA